MAVPRIAYAVISKGIKALIPRIAYAGIALFFAVELVNLFGRKIEPGFRGLTQKELGEACGIHEVAIRKYELGKNVPKPEQLRKIADALGVNVNSLMEFDIEADGDVLPLLFAIDETFDISIKDLDGEPGIFFSNKNLVQFLKDWQAMKELLDNGSQTQDNYEIWKTIRPSVTKVTHE